MKHLVYSLPVVVPLVAVSMAFSAWTGSSLALVMPTVFLCVFIGAQAIARRE